MFPRRSTLGMFPIGDIFKVTMRMFLVGMFSNCDMLWGCSQLEMFLKWVCCYGMLPIGDVSKVWFATGILSKIFPKWVLYCDDVLGWGCSRGDLLQVYSWSGCFQGDLLRGCSRSGIFRKLMHCYEDVPKVRSATRMISVGMLPKCHLLLSLPRRVLGYIRGNELFLLGGVPLIGLALASNNSSSRWCPTST